MRRHTPNTAFPQCRHSRIGKHSRMVYYPDSDLLIFELMPSVSHEGARGNLAMMLVDKVIRMGMSVRHLYYLGGSRFSAGPGPSKEADSAFKPSPRSREVDWPTIVYESGAFE